MRVLVCGGRSFADRGGRVDDYQVNEEFKAVVLEEYERLSEEIRKADITLLLLRPRIAAVEWVIKVYGINQ